MKKNKTITLVICVTIFLGCRKFIEIAPPKTSIIAEKVFEESSTANSAMLTIYGQMYNDFNINPYMLSYLTGISGDELINNFSLFTDIYINNILANSTSRAHEVWKSTYKMIYNANAIYEGCNQSTKLDPSVKKQLMAEALFIRAYWYFYLVNLYGDVPLALTTNYNTNNNLLRTSAVQVYAQIIADLKAAQNNLNENYTGADALTTSAERVRPNKAVATALLARVYLFIGDYSSAEGQSSILIDNDNIYDLVSIDQVFKKNNKEAIWQVMPTNNPSYNTQEGFQYTPTAAPPNQGKSTISPQLLGAFENGDLRKNIWVGKFIDVTKTPNVDYYYPAKYHQLAGTSILEYSVTFRLAEQYLIRAEARNEQNNRIGAIEDLNKLRARARAAVSIDIPNPLPPLESTLTKDQVKTAILKERQIEMFTEQGHRWFDLKRAKTINEVMTAVTPAKGSQTWNGNKQLWPVPQTEILNNQKLTQNLGYEQ